MSKSFFKTFGLIKSDLAFRCEYENKRLTIVQFLKFMVYPATLATMIYRFQKYFYDIRLRPISFILHFINYVFFTINIDSKAEIGPGLFIMHASFINIGPNVKIGQNCILAHQNSIMASPFYHDNTDSSAPIVGNHLMLGGGAIIEGPVVLGNNVQVSMNALVDASFPDHAVLFGVPAKNVTKTKEAQA